MVQPGFIHSRSFQNVYYTEQSNPKAKEQGPYKEFYQNMAPFVEHMMNLSLTTPEKVAELVLSVIHKEHFPLWIPATMDAKMFYYIRRIFPRRLLLPFLYWCLPKVQTWARGYSHRR